MVTAKPWFVGDGEIHNSPPPGHEKNKDKRGGGGEKGGWTGRGGGGGWGKGGKRGGPPVYDSDPLWANVEFMTMFARKPDGSNQFLDETEQHVITLGANGAVRSFNFEGISPASGGPATSGYLASIAASSALKMPGTAWCMEWFLTMADTGSVASESANIWQDYKSATDDRSAIFYKANTADGFRAILSPNGTSGAVFTTNEQPTGGVETHVAFVDYGNGLKRFYIDAIKISDTSASGTPGYDNGLDIDLCAGSNIELVRGIRFTKGLSRYSGNDSVNPNFTVPAGFGKA